METPSFSNCQALYFSVTAAENLITEEEITAVTACPFSLIAPGMEAEDTSKAIAATGSFISDNMDDFGFSVSGRSCWIYLLAQKQGVYCSDGAENFIVFSVNIFLTLKHNKFTSVAASNIHY